MADSRGWLEPLREEGIIARWASPMSPEFEVEDESPACQIGDPTARI